MNKPDKVTPKQLQRMLKSWRKRKDYTQEQAYEKLRVKRRTYENWEMAIRVPRGFALEALLRVIRK